MKAFCQIYAQWDQIGDRIEAESRHLLDLGLICDTAFTPRQGASHQQTLRAIMEAGGLCAPNIYPAGIDPSCCDTNWWKYPEEECVRLLDLAAAAHSSRNLGPLRAINTYTAGNSLVAACRKSGVEYILGFCAPTVIEDGGWEIAHYGSPLSPFFPGDEDYRKPENPGDRSDAVLISSMELRNPMVCLNHWSEGPWCPLNAQAADRWLEPAADPYPFLQIAEDWLRQSELSGSPKFFHLNLQYFFADRCRDHNRRALEWLAAQRDKGRLEIGGLQAWRQRLKENKGFVPQRTYWRGEMMGFHVGHRPGCFPDVIVEETLSGQTIWQKPHVLPQRHYDYQAKWNYPAFQPDGSAPASEAFPDITVCQQGCEIEIENTASARPVRLIAWNAGDGLQAAYEVRCLSAGWTAETAPHPSGVGGAVILSGMAASGLTHVKFEVNGTPSKLVFARSWPDLVEAQTFFANGRPYTVLASQTPEPFLVLATLKRDSHDREPVLVEHLAGIHYSKQILETQEVPLMFDGTRLACWHRFWGITADQIELCGTEEIRACLRRKTACVISEIAHDLEVNACGYQTFGNIRDKSRWDRILARAAGELELSRMRDWFQSQRPDAGEVVIEVHPGIYLPRGSITKVLGHEFDVIRCANGYRFRELCADYPQGWDWGVAAWVQWRSLRLDVEGLDAREGAFTLHLHAIDPESRDISQQVHFFNPSDSNAPVPDVCAIREWVLPQGIENRWDSGALCSVKIPAECLAWPSIGLWIVPLEKSRLYDWVAEKGAPGVLSHLWVTRGTLP